MTCELQFPNCKSDARYVCTKIVGNGGDVKHEARKIGCSMCGLEWLAMGGDIEAILDPDLIATVEALAQMQFESAFGGTTET